MKVLDIGHARLRRGKHFRTAPSIDLCEGNQDELISRIRGHDLAQEMS